MAQQWVLWIIFSLFLYSRLGAREAGNPEMSIDTAKKKKKEIRKREKTAQEKTALSSQRIGKFLQLTPQEKTCSHHLIITTSPFSPSSSPFPCNVTRGQVESLGLQPCPALAGGITLPQSCLYQWRPKGRLPPCTSRRNSLPS